jgi:hypothetical protein
MDDRTRDDQDEQNESRRRKRPYTTPKVVDYGSVTQLTAGSLSKQSDQAAAGFRKLN